MTIGKFLKECASETIMGLVIPMVISQGMCNRVNKLKDESFIEKINVELWDQP